MRQWEAVYRTTEAIHGRLQVEELAGEVLRLAAELVGATGGSLLLLDAEGLLVYTAVLGPWATALVGQTAPVGRGVAGSVLRAGEGRVTLDLGAAARAGGRGAAAGRSPSARARRAASAPRPTLLTAPLKTPRGAVLGVLQLLDCYDGVFDADDLAVVNVVAALAATALDTLALRAGTGTDPAAREREARLQYELAIGRRIQMSLLPPPRLSFPGFEVVSRCEPAAEVGGDFYDLFPVELSETRSECWGIVLGDVAGKGIPSALLMAVTTTLIRAQARQFTGPGAALAAVGAELRPRMRPPGGAAPFFATAVCGLLDTTRREIRLANAGQTPPVYWPAGGEPRYVRLTGLPLGSRPAARYAETSLDLAPGDRLLFLSDGFIEARDTGGEVVGYSGFLRRLEALSERRAGDLIAALFASEGAADDDRTAVLVTAT
jgi:sigma-B regulation protein RsbU (phosphoserine phosphatase)